MKTVFYFNIATAITPVFRVTWSSETVLMCKFVAQEKQMY